MFEIIPYDCLLTYGFCFTISHHKRIKSAKWNRFLTIRKITNYLGVIINVSTVTTITNYKIASHHSEPFDSVVWYSKNRYPIYAETGCAVVVFPEMLEFRVKKNNTCACKYENRN